LVFLNIALNHLPASPVVQTNIAIDVWLNIQEGI